MGKCGCYDGFVLALDSRFWLPVFFQGTGVYGYFDIFSLLIPDSGFLILFQDMGIYGCFDIFLVS